MQLLKFAPSVLLNSS